MLKKNNIFIFWIICCVSGLNAQIDTISGLSLWLRSDSGVVLDAGGHVKQWNDFSNNQFVFVQNDSNARPFLKSETHVLSFDGNDFFDGGNILNLTTNGTSIFLLSKTNSNSGSFLAKSFYGGVNSRYSLLVDNSNFMFLYHDNVGRTFTHHIQLGAYYLWSIIINNQNNIISIFKNGIEIGSLQFNGNFEMASPYNFLIGAYNNNLGTIPPLLFLNGEIAEIIMIDKALNNETRFLIDNYLMNKLAPPVKLPSDTILTSLCPILIKPEGFFVSYLWNNGSNADSIIVTKTGWYKVTATDIFGRISKDSIWVQFPGYINPSQKLCYNDSLILNTNLNENYYTFLWHNNSTLPYYVAHSAGQYYVQITDTNNCSYLSDTIYVEYDSFSFENDIPDSVLICLGDTLNAFHSQALNYNWSTNDINSFILPQNENWYYVTITNSNNCKLIDSSYVQFKGQKPQPTIQIHGSCSRQALHYSGTSTGNIVQWQWILEDSIIRTGQNIQYTYSQPGIYNTILKVVDINTCIGHAFSIDTIHDTPKTSFVYYEGCNGQNTLFKSQATCLDSIVEFVWEINNQVFYGQDFQNTFSASNYIVKHKAISEYGCVDYVLHVVPLISSPPQQATPNYPNEGMNISDSTITFSFNNFNQLSFIEISSTSDFSQVIYRSIKTPFNFLNVAFLPLNCTLFWRIWTFNNCNDSVVSNTFSFQRYTELNFPNLMLSIKADKGAILDNSNQLKIWEDQSPNQFSFIQNDSLARPRILPSVILNNKPIVIFDGINDFFSGGNILNLTNKGTTAFILANTQTSNSAFISKSLYGQAQSRYSFLTENNNFIFIYHDEHNRIVTFPFDNNFNLWLININNFNNNIKVIKNRTDSNTITFNGSYNMNSTYDFLIGAYNNSNGTIPPVLFLKGNIAEIIMFDTTLSQPQIQIIEKYLMDKYAPPVLLPADTVLTSFCPFAIVPRGYFTSYQWNTGDTNDTLIVYRSGKYTVTATDIFGRISKDSIYVKFPDTQIPDSVFVCYGDSALITSSLGNIVDYQWSNGNNKNFSYVKNHGWYYITVTDLHGCSSIDSFFVKVDSLSLTSLFLQDTTNLCDGNKLHILQNIPYSINQFYWSPTNDTTNFTTVSTPNWYIVTVKDIHNCIGKDSIYVNILGKAPVAQFSASHTCLGQSTTLTSTAYSQDSAIINYWQWIINNTDTLYGDTIQHLFSNYGNQNIKLEVSTSSGCYQTIENNIFVHPLPNINFNAYGFCERQLTQFISTNSIPFGNVVDYFWNFGDGNTSIDMNPQHIYSQSGMYQVSYTAISNESCQKTITKEIEIKYTPRSGFIHGSSCATKPTFFTDTSKTLSYYPIIQWKWHFGDGNSSSQQNPVHTYNNPGTYQTKLIIKTINGCTDTITKDINVSTSPMANFVHDSACVYQILNIQDISEIQNGTIENRKWFIGSNYYSNQPNISLIPYQTGSLPITLIVESNTHCFDTIVKTLDVKPKPQVSFSANPSYGTAPLTVNFLNSSDAGLSYWQFGDGNVSSQFNPQHTYNDTGKYIVRLLLTNNNGCFDTANKVILVVPYLMDLSVEDISIQSYSSYLTVSAKIANVGTLPIENPEVQLWSNGRFMIAETVFDTLFSGDILWYTFNGKINTQIVTPRYVCVHGTLNSALTEVTTKNNMHCKALEYKEQVLNFYPNPVFDKFTLEYYLTDNQEVGIFIYDITGKLIYKKDFLALQEYNRVDVNVSFLNKGVYTVNFQTKQISFKTMIIKL